MTRATSVLLPLALLGLSACAGPTPSQPIARYAVGDVATRGPLAILPAPAGRVVAVRRTDYANGVSEQVVLNGPRAMAGENRITIEAVVPGGGTGPSDRILNLTAPSEASLEAEMAAQIPDARMAISTDAERNAEGPFGYATGSAGPLTCLYAWQYLAPKRPLSLVQGLLGARPGVTSVRIRLCRDLPAATLVRLVRDLSIMSPDTQSEASASAEAVPYEDAPKDALEAALGPANGIRAFGPDISSAAIDPAPSTRPRRRVRRVLPSPVYRVRVRRATRPAPQMGSGLAGATRVPMPGDVASDGGEPTRKSIEAPVPDRAVAGQDQLPLPK